MGFTEFETFHKDLLARLDIAIEHAPKNSKGLLKRLKWEVEVYPHAGPCPQREITLASTPEGASAELTAHREHMKARDAWEEAAQAYIPEDYND